jgi:hypothetical protein
VIVGLLVVTVCFSGIVKSTVSMVCVVGGGKAALLASGEAARGVGVGTVVLTSESEVGELEGVVSMAVACTLVS